jgi:hypothetical protein
MPNLELFAIGETEMIGLPYAFLTAYSTSGTMGLLVFLAAIALVTIDHALESTLEQHYA